MADVKFGRNFTLTVEREDGKDQVITLPFTIEFDITRNTFSSMNTASIRIYNLNEQNRSQLRFNFYNFGEYRKVRLQAGYGENLFTVFSGNMTKAWSVREGVNFISQIECLDGGFAVSKSVSDESFQDGTPFKSMVTKFVKTFADNGVDIGAIGAITGEIGRGKAYSGNTAEQVRQIVGNSFYIDNEKAYILGNDEYVDAPLMIINSSTGLLGTPTREKTMVMLDMLFEPKLQMSQLVRVESSTSTSFNTEYKVVAIKHRGTISSSVCGDAITSVNLQPAIAAFEAVQGS